MAFVKGQVANPHGRPKGSKNKRDIIADMLREQAISSGLLPLDFFLSVMRSDEMPLGVRFEAGRAAAPYVHRKMPIAIENLDAPYKVLDIGALKGLTDEELEQLQLIMAKAVKADQDADVAAFARPRGLPRGIDPRIVATVEPGGATKLLSPPKPAPKPKPKRTA